MKYLEKYFNQIDRALYGGAIRGTNRAAVKCRKQLLLSFAIKSITYHSSDCVHSR